MDELAECRRRIQNGVADDGLVDSDGQQLYFESCLIYTLYRWVESVQMRWIELQRKGYRRRFDEVRYPETEGDWVVESWRKRISGEF